MRRWLWPSVIVVASCGAPALPSDGQRADAGQEVAAEETGAIEDTIQPGDPSIVPAYDDSEVRAKALAPQIGQLNLASPDGMSGFYHLDFFRLVVSRLRGRGV